MSRRSFNAEIDIAFPATRQLFEPASDLHEKVVWVVKNLALVLVSRTASLQVP